MRMQDVRSGARRSDLRAVILTADRFKDMELFVPFFGLLDQEVQVDIAAPSMDEIDGERGYRIVPDLLIDDVDPDGYDLRLIPEGSSDRAHADGRPPCPHRRDDATDPSRLETARPALTLQASEDRHRTPSRQLRRNPPGPRLPAWGTTT